MIYENFKKKFQTEKDKSKISAELINIMKANEIDCFDLNDGQLVYSKKCEKTYY